MAAVVAFAGSRSSVSCLVAPVVASVLASGDSVAVGCAAGVDAAVASAVVAAGAASRLAVFAVQPAPSLSWVRSAAAAGASVCWVAPGPVGRAAFAVRSRLVLHAAVGSGPGAALAAFPSTPCPAACVPVRGASVLSSRVIGGGSGTWLAVALAVSAGLPVAVFLPAGVAAPAWAGGSWVPCTAPGVWGAALAWRPSSPSYQRLAVALAGWSAVAAVSPSGEPPA